jgi:hypothetical protein
MTQELWASIAGYEGRYEISSFGRVKSVARIVASAIHPGGSKWTKGRILKTHTWGAQYPGVVLVAADGSRRRRMVHRLVAEAFVPNPAGFGQINHMDADTFNARAENLEWCDQAANVKHAYHLGNRPTGAEHHFATLPRDSAGHCVARGANMNQTL